ncbi:MAG: cache domain-containing protein [Pseudomonadota bacterium]
MSNARFWSIAAVLLLLCVLALGWGLARLNLASFSNQVGDRLQLLNELRRGAMQQYFSTAEAELKFWASSPQLVVAQQELLRRWQEEEAESFSARVRRDYIDNNPFPPGEMRNYQRAGDTSYCDLHAELQPVASLFVTQRGYYDFFLVGLDGYVYFSVEKEDDFGTSLLTGPYRSTGLGQAFRAAVQSPGEVVLTDMAPYAPSADAPAMFMAQTVVDPMGLTIGVLALQLPTNQILGIMGYLEGMGESGETYLVGDDGLMRSDSRFSDASTVLKLRVDTRTVARALAGEEGVEFTPDYRDVEVLSAYSSMAVGDTRWAVMAEIDREEIVALAAGEMPDLAGVLALVYGLSLWTLWYWRGRHMPGEDGAAIQAVDLGGGDSAGESGLLS